MRHVLVYADSLSWGIVPGTRQRLPFEQRWPGAMELALLQKGLEVRVKSIVANQFGAQIERVARETAQTLGADGALIELDDRGAVDCTIRSRVETALLRAKGEKA